MMHSASYGAVDNNNIVEILEYLYTISYYFNIKGIYLHPNFYSETVKILLEFEEYEIIATQTKDLLIRIRDKTFPIILNSLMDGNFCIISR
jgi:hypothetical protein